MRTGPTNPLIQALIADLRKATVREGVNLWSRLADDLEKPTRSRRIVNLTKISRYSKDSEIVVVPGKVLADGSIDRKVVVSAMSFSSEAEKKIRSAGGEAISIQDLLKRNPKVSNVRIIG